MIDYPLLNEAEFLTIDRVHLHEESEVENQFVHFLKIKADRLQLFCKHVFKENSVELSIEKLQAIYYFFKQNITARVLSSEEINLKRQQLPNHLKEIHAVPNYAFEEPTFSIIFDTGIYFGELLRKELPELIWFIERDKRLANYGYEGLKMKGRKLGCYPRWIIGTSAIQIYEGRFSEDGLTDLFLVWKNLFLKRVGKK